MTEPRDRAQAMYQEVFGHPRRKPSGEDKEFDELTLDHLYGTVWTRPELNVRDRCLVTVSILAALGRDEELCTHLQNLSRQGFTRRQVTELMIHVAHYAGWPAGHAAIRVARDALDSSRGRTQASGSRGRDADQPCLGN